MESIAFKLGVWAISWRGWLLQTHTWEIRPSRLNDPDDQVSWAYLVGQPLHAVNLESGLAIGQVCLEAGILSVGTPIRRRDDAAPLGCNFRQLTI